MDLGLERAGHEIVWQVEIDDWCRRILSRHWPDVAKFSDVKDLTGDELAPVDLICGGFPCQPVSLAGRGLAQADERWLWPEFHRIVRLLRPRFVLVENVPGLLARGLGDVLGDLAASGYDAEWDCIPAAAVGAPHLRYRVFIVAHARGEQHESEGFADARASSSGLPAPNSKRVELRDESGWGNGSSGPGATVARDDGSQRAVADADSRRLEGERSGRLFDRERPPFRDDADGCHRAVADADGATWPSSKRSQPRAWSTQAGQGKAGF